MANSVNTFEAYIQSKIDAKKNEISMNNFDTYKLYKNYIDWLIEEKNQTATVNELLFQIAVISAYVATTSKNQIVNTNITMDAVTPELIAGIDIKKNDFDRIIQTHFKNTDTDVYNAVHATSNKYFNEYTRNRIVAGFAASALLLAGCFAPTATGFTMLFSGIMSGICFAAALYMVSVRMRADTTKPEIEFFGSKDYLKNQNRYLKAKVHAIHEAINPINPNTHQYDRNSEIIKTQLGVAKAITTQNTNTNGCLIKTIRAATQNRYALMYTNSKAPCTQKHNGSAELQNVDLKTLSTDLSL